MLEPFFRTHQFLVEHTDAPVRRVLMGGRLCSDSEADAWAALL